MAAKKVAIKGIKNLHSRLPKKERLLKGKVSFSRAQLIVFAIVFATVGGYAVWRSLAAPVNFVNTTPITGLTEPTNMLFTPDGRMLVLGRRGIISVVQPGATQVDATPFLQLPAGQVAYDNERGLLGLALDPSFSTNGNYYIYYTEASTLKNRISRFTASGNTTSLATETLVWKETDTSDIYHQGGNLAFGPDGKLYVSVGDHLSSASAQNLSTTRGKILRMNSDGTIPTDNPFYDGAGPNKDEIWALGFRNPFRFSFDPTSGRMYEGDVGENTWEEVNIVVKGANYGWPDCEGSCGNAGMTNPIYTYNHNGRDASITGGFVYRGTQFPSTYQGAYFFADYAQNWIKYLSLDANGNSTGVHNFEPNSATLDGPYGDPVAMVMAPDGSLNYVDIGPFQTTGTGKIRQIKYTAANQPPVAQSAASVVTSTTAPLAVNFSSAGSSDPESQPLTYSWDFGDGSTSTQANPSHTYNSRGSFSAKLTVSDGVNSTQANPIAITVGNPPVATITSPANGATFTAGQSISFSGGGSDPEDGNLTGTSLSWTVVFHHAGHIHPGPGPFTGPSGSFTMPSSGHDFTGTTSYEITLTATDSDGFQTSSSVFIYPQKVNLTLATAPTGGNITVDGIPHTTPYTFDSLIGFQHAIDAPSPQIISASRYKYNSWSDGGMQTHNITVPTTDQTYTASFDIDNSLPPGLVAAYPFSEGSGLSTVDFSGNGNGATLNASTTWAATGKYGKALNFDGSAAFTSASDSNTLDLTASGTVEAWVKLNTLGRWHSLVAKGNANATNAHNYALEITNTNMVECGISDGTTGNVLDSVSTLQANQFYHIACVWTGSGMALYINGISDNTGPQTVTPAGNAATLYMGQYGGGVDRLSGTLDEVRIYNRALNASEVLADMNSGLDTSPPPDTTAPTISMTAPANGATVSTANVTVSANASDNVAVAGVQFILDGTGNIGAEDTTSPYSTSWDTTTLPNGTHTLSAIARDAAGNITTAASITVTVNNIAPPPPDTAAPTTPANLRKSSATTTSVSLAWDASTDTGGSGLRGYRIFKGGTFLVEIPVGSGLSYTDSGLTPNTNYSYKISAIDNAVNESAQSAALSASTNALLPTASLSASPTTIVSGNSSTLTWSSTNATSCTASGAWTGAKATSGSQGVSPNATSTYTITCNGTGGSASSNATVTVNQPAPTANLTASPNTITAGGSSTLTWSSTNATSCTGSGAWSGAKATNGTQSVSPTSTSTYSMTCTGAGGTTTPISAMVSVNAPPPTPTASITASPNTITTGGSSTLTWSSTNATSCTASGAWSGNQALSGSLIISPPATSTYNITCNGVGGSASNSTTVTVNTPPPPPPPTPTVTGDLNGDSHVNIFDLSILLSHYGSSGTGDIDGNGIVNIIDLSKLLSNYGK